MAFSCFGEEGLAKVARFKEKAAQNPDILDVASRNVTSQAEDIQVIVPQELASYGAAPDQTAPQGKDLE